MTDTSETTWFLAELKRQSHLLADRNLKRQGFSTFLPMEEVTLRQRGKFGSTLRPLFPGYIFVSFDTVDGHWRAINSTFGVKRLVRFGNEPAPVPPEIIAELLLRCDADGKLLPAKQLKPGDPVRFTSGPFAEFVATVENIAPDRRVWVLMELMGALTRIAVQADGLRLA